MGTFEACSDTIPDKNSSEGTLRSYSSLKGSRYKKSLFQFESKGQKRPTSQLKEIKQEETPLTPLREGSLLILLKAPADWMRTTHIQKGNLLYSAHQVTFSNPALPSHIYPGCPNSGSPVAHSGR